MFKQYYVYFITNKTSSILYVGVTSDLVRRIYEHQNKLIEGFTSKYNISKLVYFEVFSDPENAIAREKQIKNWNRAKKNALVEAQNAEWRDLSEDWA